MSAVTGIYWLNGHRDHLSKKQQHNHKGIYFMICNEVQILPTTLNNQIKPNFPSLEGQRVYKSRRSWKGLFCFWSTQMFLVATLMGYGIIPTLSSGKLRHDTNHLFLQSKLLRRLKKWLAHRFPRCCKSSSQNVLSSRAQMSSAIWDTTGYSGLCRRLRSARGCCICQPVYALDISKYTMVSHSYLLVTQLHPL